jgi:hypothetical protein
MRGLLEAVPVFFFFGDENHRPRSWAEVPSSPVWLARSGWTRKRWFFVLGYNHKPNAGSIPTEARCLTPRPVRVDWINRIFTAAD